MNTRKKVRDAILAQLADATKGFAARHAAIGATYGIFDPIKIDFQPGSKNLFQGYLTPETIDVSQIAEYPAVILYTDSAVPNAANRNLSEVITAHIAFVIQHSFRLDSDDEVTIEADDTESELDAIEDAAKTVLMDPGTPWQTLGVIYAQEYAVSRSTLILLGDGFEQWLFFDLTFEVDF